MTDNKRVSNKQILDKINDLKVGEEGLNALAIKIVSRMMNIKTMSEWYDHVSRSSVAGKIQSEKLDMTEEEDAIGDAARYMTLMNLFEDKEEYEKCAICKTKLDSIQQKLDKLK